MDPTPYFNKTGLPIIPITNFGWHYPAVQKILDAGRTVMLVGELGNAVWSWDGLHSLSDLARRGQWITLARELCNLNRQQEGRGYREFKTVLLHQVPRWLRPFLRRIRRQPEDPWRSHSGISLKFAKENGLLERSRRINLGTLLRVAPNGRNFRIGFVSRMASRIDLILTMRSVFGLEERLPLLDIRLMEYCLAVPHNQYIRNGVTRRLTRHIVADRLPDIVIHNKKIGMQNPEWFSRVTPLRQKMIADVERFKRSPLASHLLDLPRLKTLLEQWPKDAVAAQQLEYSYHLLLPKTIHTGCFLLWAEQGSGGK